MSNLEDKQKQPPLKERDVKKENKKDHSKLQENGKLKAKTNAKMKIVPTPGTIPKQDTDESYWCIHKNLTTLAKKLKFSELKPNEKKWCCMQDAAPFDGPIFFICHNINYDLNEYYCSGIFCSFECVLSYLMERSNNRTAMLHSNSWQAYKKQIQRLPPAIVSKLDPNPRPRPPQDQMEKFGGTLTLEEYRKTVI